MLRLQYFKGNDAVFSTGVGKDTVTLHKEDVLRKRDLARKAWKHESICSQAEEYKFALDRWPDTKLGQRLRKFAPTMYKQ